MEPCKKCHNRYSISVHFHALMRSEWHLRSGPLWPPGFYPQNSKTFCFLSGIAQISSPPNSSTFTKISAAIYILIIHTLSSPPAGSTWRCLNGTDQCLRLHTVCVASLLLEDARLPNIHPSSCPLAFGTTDICSSWSCRSALRDQLKHAKLSISSLLRASGRYTHAVMVLAMLAKNFTLHLVIGATNVQQFRLGWKSCEWLLCWWQPGCRRFARKFFTLRALLHKKASTSDIFNNFCESTQISQ